VIKQLPDLSLNQTTGCRYIAYSVVRYFFEPPALEWYYRYSKIGYEQLQSIICDSCWMFQSVIYSCNHLHEADEISHTFELCHAKVSLIWFVHFAYSRLYSALSFTCQWHYVAHTVITYSKQVCWLNMIGFVAYFVLYAATENYWNWLCFWCFIWSTNVM